MTELYLVQSSIYPGRPEKTAAHIEFLLEKNPPSSKGVVLLPELFRTGPVSDLSTFREWGGESILKNDLAFLRGLARRWNCVVMGSSLGWSSGKMQNLSLTFGPTGRLYARYQKIHPFTLGGEGENFTSGPKPVRRKLAGFLWQPTICYDLRFPELYAMGFRQGVELFTVQANWPASRQHHWEALLQARAIETQSVVAGVNCSGTMAGLEYVGGSRVISPTGKILAQAGKKPGVLRVEISPGAVRRWRRTFPVLRDKKPWAFYQGK